MHAFALTLLLAAPQATPADDAATAFQELVAADHWRKRNAARDKLIELGEEAFEVVLEGTSHDTGNVRAKCYEILFEHFPADERALEAFVRGLTDTERTYVAYPCAFHFGQHGIEAGRVALRGCMDDAEIDKRTLYAAAKSLGELGDKEMTSMLWEGMGSDDPYTRYLSNLGMKGLSGKDLSDFEYESPWEGAFVSGPNVARSQGQPIEKAEKRIARWQAVVAWTKWAKGHREDLYAELEKALW